MAACVTMLLSPDVFADAGQTNTIVQETPAQKTARLKWWNDARFGLFIHWGLYSIPAGEWNGGTDYGEWFLEQTHMPVSQYEKYANQFNPLISMRRPGCARPKWRA
ncbi:MAG: alpha-L-fucosidase [Limisphaerales bacterium]